MNGRVFSRATVLASWIVLLAFGALCQIAMKYAGIDNGEFDFTPRAFVLAASSPWLWTALVLAVVVLPLVKWSTAVTMGALRSGSTAPFKAWRDSVPSLGGQALLSLVLLPDQARLAADAIVRTLYRLFVSRRRLLEWETAAST